MMDLQHNKLMGCSVYWCCHKVLITSLKFLWLKAPQPLVHPSKLALIKNVITSLVKKMAALHPAALLRFLEPLEGNGMISC